LTLHLKYVFLCKKESTTPVVGYPQQKIKRHKTPKPLKKTKKPSPRKKKNDYIYNMQNCTNYYKAILEKQKQKV